MEREPHLTDRVKTPKGSGPVAARSETHLGWLIVVQLDEGSDVWKGAASEVELLEATGEQELRERVRGEEIAVSAREDKT